MRTKFTTLMLMASLILSGCSAAGSDSVSVQNSSTKELLSYSNLSYDSGFDTVYVYNEFGYDHDAMKKNFEKGVSIFAHANDLFDIYNDYENISNLKTINDNAGIQPVQVEPEIIDMLKTAKYFYELSNGEFDITMGALLKVWHRYRDAGIALNEKGESAPVPSEDELKAAAVYKGWDKVEIDEENNTVFITDPNVSLDVGGIAKGYAAEEIGQALEKEDIVYATVNAGRNIRTIHSKADGSDWRIGIQNPSGEGSIVVISTKGSMSVVTSGDYERFFVGTDGKSYHHIIDPSTMYPSEYYHSVTILTPDSAAADCLSTTLFTMSVADGQHVLDEYTRHTGNAAAAVWIMDPAKSQNAEGVISNDYFITWSPSLDNAIEY